MNTRLRLPRLLFSVAIVVPSMGCKPPQPPPSPPAKAAPVPKAPTVSETADAIFAAYFASHPVSATAAGVHEYDTAWPDLSEAGLEAERTRIESARSALAQAAAANVDDQVDLEILDNALNLSEFVVEVEQPWRTDPHWYVSLIGSGIDDLISRDFAPVETRAASVEGRLLGLPALVEQAKANLDAAACKLPHTTVAIDQIDGLVALVRATALERIAEAPEEIRQRVGAASAPAVQALRDLQQHLRKTVLPVAAGPWRLGPENFERKLRLTLDAEVRADALRRDAVIEHGRVRKEMAEIAGELAEPLLGRATVRRIVRRAQGDPNAALTPFVLEALGQWHVQPKALRDAVEANLTRLSDFVAANDIVPLDPAEALEVIWTPPHQQGVFIAGLAAPGALEPQEAGLPSFYLVQPIPKAWSPKVTASFLREYNNFMLEILSIHEAIPGHFVQLYYGKREPSKVRRVLQNGAFVEGWAVYTEHVMVEAGYDGIGPSADAKRPRSIDRGLWTVMVTPELRAKAIALHGLKFYLRTITNTILDHGVHAGTMTREDALELMIERSYQGEGEAVGKWTRAQLTSAQLSTYYAGVRAWTQLRAQAEARGGFSMSQFHAEALSHGAPPVEALPRLMGWTADGAQPKASDESTDTVEVADEAAGDEPPPASADEFDEALDDVLNEE